MTEFPFAQDGNPPKIAVKGLDLGIRRGEVFGEQFRFHILWNWLALRRVHVPERDCGRLAVSSAVGNKLKALLGGSQHQKRNDYVFVVCRPTGSQWRWQDVGHPHDDRLPGAHSRRGLWRLARVEPEAQSVCGVCSVSVMTGIEPASCMAIGSAAVLTRPGALNPSAQCARLSPAVSHKHTTLNPALHRHCRCGGAGHPGGHGSGVRAHGCLPPGARFGHSPALEHACKSLAGCTPRICGDLQPQLHHLEDFGQTFVGRIS